MTRNESLPLHERRFVRIRERHDGFVEFDFAIGDPELFVELILTDAAFDEFCTANRVQRLDDRQAEQIDRYRGVWVRPGDGGEANDKES